MTMSGRFLAGFPGGRVSTARGSSRYALLNRFGRSPSAETWWKTSPLLLPVVMSTSQ